VAGAAPLQNPGENFDANDSDAAGSAAARRTEPLHAWAHGFTVTGKSGRQRTELLVVSPHCSAVHSHRAPVGYVTARRASGCGRGRYVVIARTIEGSVAA
jgi:hypothetical protein